VSAPAALAASDETELRAQIEKLVLSGFGLSKTALNTILDDFTANGCPADLRSLLLT
jgi:hypothetical protein